MHRIFVIPQKAEKGKPVERRGRKVTGLVTDLHKIQLRGHPDSRT